MIEWKAAALAGAAPIAVLLAAGLVLKWLSPWIERMRPPD